ncbi:dihydrolipoyllysine-residue succinyltransferase [Candidatus Erwinia haradaeae]|uniref:Dihydrolipoyllysine-residue succinyltransferase n=1 Tax=Candidatus Erwinia haradaeae TaxID=1922217 RepID=A0A451D8V5_9GAMM|nr:dihydrolipoyllysine-residue succinyltransferase [Candidatus Erwinia haradaeae]VFP82281.1 Dihydrolipoyllysine-residue succinyltransferase component of 2-oxoglutarate dehydrogenase complex [Candidatus Erwinia haradaeae]
MSSINITVPDLPESVSEATVSKWHKKIGDTIKRDEILVDIETDKVIIEIPATHDGILTDIIVNSDSSVKAHQILGIFNSLKTSNPCKSFHIPDQINSLDSHKTNYINTEQVQSLSPSMRRLVHENDVQPQILKNNNCHTIVSKEKIKEHSVNSFISSSRSQDEKKPASLTTQDRSEKRIPMTLFRKRMAERLLQTKNTTAMLTTFNEINVQPILTLRKKYGLAFENKHSVRLGLMPFYIRAVIESLKHYPEINASIDDSEIVYHNYFDISIAVSTPRGVITPVLRNADILSISDMEKTVKELATKARNNKLNYHDLTGGTFTITNGGVFGSLLSTPLINPPQSAILGMHAIKDRPMAIDGQIVILPMMYLALSYDHRLIDGREAVGYLEKLKSLLEDPTRILLDI